MIDHSACATTINAGRVNKVTMSDHNDDDDNDDNHLSIISQVTYNSGVR